MLGQSNSNTIAAYIKVENEDITVTQNGVYEAGEEYTGLGTVTVNVESTLNNQDKTVTPTTSQQPITADQGYTGLGTVTVNAVTHEIDQNISSSNIKQGVTILGVPGSVVELNPTTVTVTPDIIAQTITPEGGYNGFSTVNVDAVDHTIDLNIVSSNIKSGVTILDVPGSVVELSGTTLEVTPTAASQSHIPTAPNNAFTSVSVAGDQNLVSGNIVKDVTIFGVTGSYEGSIVNNQDLTVTENGIYTHDAGYTGLGTVSVNVPAGTIISGQNTLGYDINADTKVWVNATEYSNYEYSNGHLDDGILTLYQFGSLSSYASGQPTSFDKVETIVKCKIPQINTSDAEVQYVSALCSTGLINTDVESGGETEWLNMDIVLYAGDGKYYIVAEIPNVPNARIEAQSGSALYNFNLNDWLYLKFEKDLNTLKLWYSSDDGETWTLFGSVNDVSINPNACSYIGFYAGNETEQGVQYDLSECKVIFDNVVYWTPETTNGYQIVPSNLIDSNSLAGVTNEAILSHTSGEVKILEGTGSYEPIVSTKNITENGIYYSQSDGLYGYNEVTVSVPSDVNNQNKTASVDGTYIPDEGYSGLGEVVVTAGAIVAAEIEAQLHEINSGSSEESYSEPGM